MSDSENFPIIESGALTRPRALFGLIPRPIEIPSCGAGQVIVLVDGGGKSSLSPSAGEKLHGTFTAFVKVDSQPHHLSFPRVDSIATTAGSFEVSIELEVWVVDPVSAAQSKNSEVKRLIQPRLARAVRTADVSRVVDSETRGLLVALQGLRKEVFAAVSKCNLPFDWMRFEVLEVDVQPDRQVAEHLRDMQGKSQQSSSGAEGVKLTAQADEAQIDRMGRFKKFMESASLSPAELLVVRALMDDDRDHVAKVLSDLSLGRIEISKARLPLIQTMIDKDFLDSSSPTLQRLSETLLSLELEGGAAARRDSAEEASEVRRLDGGSDAQRDDKDWSDD